jgi:hypothetical protein
MTPDFIQSDAILGHLDGLIVAVDDDFIKSRYTGFVAVTAVTAFENNIRSKMVDFCTRKHKVFGAFSEALFDKTNARIKLDHLRNEYLHRFGDRYLIRFKKKLNDVDTACLQAGLGSVKHSYTNIVQWRHDFVHDGALPNYAGYDEARAAYELGKKVIEAFFESLNR